jgi:hypothetical protein
MAARKMKKAERYSIFEKTRERAAGSEAYGHSRRRLRELRGPAREQLCICGAPAVAWVLRADVPARDVLLAPDRDKADSWGIRFSRNPDHYDARCSDHRKAQPEAAPTVKRSTAKTDNETTTTRRTRKARSQGGDPACPGAAWLAQASGRC